MNQFLTVSGEHQTRYEILRSVFICTISGIDTYEQGLEFCRNVAQKYNNATHNCYAILTFDSQKFSDDGEPQGTAGQPILQVLKNNDLTNVACVVTRYFGGVKLGAGGLVSAYTKSVADCLKVANIVTKILSEKGRIVLDYNEFSLFNKYILAEKLIPLDIVYGESVELNIAVPCHKKQAVEDMASSITTGKKNIAWVGQDYFIYK